MLSLTSTSCFSTKHTMFQYYSIFWHLWNWEGSIWLSVITHTICLLGYGKYISNNALHNILKTWLIIHEDVTHYCRNWKNTSIKTLFIMVSFREMAWSMWSWCVAYQQWEWGGCCNQDCAHHKHPRVAHNGGTPSTRIYQKACSQHMPHTPGLSCTDTHRYNYHWQNQL